MEKTNNLQHPIYHFACSGWMNDINGLLYWKGKYHLFFQHNPYGAYWHNISWGHASSNDFVHWDIHPVAIAPGPEEYDSGGCYSGNVFLDDEGMPIIIYHGASASGGTCLAIPEDPEDALLLRWKKHDKNPVIPVLIAGNKNYNKYVVFDPSKPWKGEDKNWYVLAGNQYIGENQKTGGDVTYLFKSHDLLQWEYIGPFYKSKREWTTPEEDCAVPCFYKIGDKYILMFSSHVFGTQYYTGILDKNTFVPQYHDRFSFPGGINAGAIVESTIDGRLLHLGWVFESRDVKTQKTSGWSGVMTLPWELTLDKDGAMCVQPVRELEQFRQNKRSMQNIRVESGQEKNLTGFDGDVLEMELVIDPGSARLCGVKVRSSGDGLEETGIYYDAEDNMIRIDLSRSTLDPKVEYRKYFAQYEHAPMLQRVVRMQEAPFKLSEREKLHLRIFLDRSVIEIFANGRRAMVQRIYPTLERSKGIALFALHGEAFVEHVTVWDIVP